MGWPITGISTLSPERQLYEGGWWDGMAPVSPALWIRPKGWTMNASIALLPPLASSTCKQITGGGDGRGT